MAWWALMRQMMYLWHYKMVCFPHNRNIIVLPPNIWLTIFKIWTCLILNTRTFKSGKHTVKPNLQSFDFLSFLCFPHSGLWEMVLSSVFGMGLMIWIIIYRKENNNTIFFDSLVKEVIHISDLKHYPAAVLLNWCITI